MKINLCILITLFSLIFLASFGQSQKPDTTFLLKENSENVYHSIFIDTNRNSKFYKAISTFNFDESEQTTYNNSLNYLRKHKIRLQKKIIEYLPKRWISLKQYKEQFYSYYPSDFQSNYKIAITDSTLIDYTGEGPIANKIIEFKKINNKIFKFSLTGVNEQNRTLTIHIVDPKKGIAVFEENSKNKAAYFYLMIAAEKIKEFPIIVNFCETQKQPEFTFENPNFKLLLKQNKGK